MKRRTCTAWLTAAVAVILFTCTTITRAAAPEDAPLAAQVPNDALFYVGWAGADRVSESFQGTHAQALLAETNLPDVFERYVPQLLTALAREDAEARPVAEAISEIGPILWRHPTALAFGGVHWESEQNNGEPMPRLLLVCDAGEDAPVLRARLAGVFTRMGAPELVTLLNEQDGRVYLSLGWAKLDLAQLNDGGEGSLVAGEAFTNVADDVTGWFDKGLMKVVYIDVSGITQVMLEGVARDEGDQQAQEARDAIEALGLNGIGRVCIATGFNGEDYGTASFMEVAAERQGLLRLLPPAGSALDTETLAAIPSDATLVAASRFEIGEAVDIARALVNHFDPDSAQQFEQALGFAGMFAGADVERNLLGQFGETWAAFISPQIGQSLASAVVVNSPKDATILRRALMSLSLNSVAMGKQAVREETENKVTIPGRAEDFGDLRVFFLNAPLVAPSWAVGDSHLYAALFPQNIAAASNVRGGFTDGEAWAAVQELVGDNEPVMLSYTDLRATAPSAYPMLLSYSQLAFGAGDLFSDYLRAVPPSIVLPPLPTVMEHVTPAVSAGWVDEDGFHFRSREPFPLSGVLTSTGGGMEVGTISTMAGILLPSLNRAREAANRVKSGSNLRQIGQGVHLYANDHDGRLPDSLGEIFASGYGIPMEVFLSPRTDSSTPEMMAQAIEVQADWINANSDYVYVGNGRKLSEVRNSVQTPLAWEDPDLVEDGINILFFDGHVEFIEFPRAYEVIERAPQE